MRVRAIPKDRLGKIANESWVDTGPGPISKVRQPGYRSKMAVRLTGTSRNGAVTVAAVFS